MKAIILAAGVGSRLRPLTEDKPKCLLKIGTEIAIERQVRLLNSIGITDITAVVGFEAQQIRDAVPRLRYIENKDYVSTSSLYSLSLTEKHLDGNVLILNSDIVYDIRFIEKLAESKNEKADVVLAVDFSTPYEDIDVGVQFKNDKIIKVSKNMTEKHCDAESIDGFFVSKKGLSLLKETMYKVLSVSKANGGVYTLKNELAFQRSLDYKDVSGSCTEFDTLEEYEKAKRLFAK